MSTPAYPLGHAFVVESVPWTRHYRRAPEASWPSLLAGPARTETIEAAAEKIRSSGVTDLTTWQSLSIGGRLIINTICEAIDKAQLFVADVTLLNSNVLFEIGFAIARKKRIWFILDDSVDRARSSFERFELLTTIGYRPYRNSNDVVRWFLQDAPYRSLDKTVYGDVFDVVTRHPPSSLVYLKSEIETDASIRMSRRIDEAHFSALVDDPSEMRRQSSPGISATHNQQLA